MSRLVVKNLPNKIKEQRIRDIFTSQGGEITDVKLCFTKDKVFRRFGFVGYKNESEAMTACTFHNGTFIDTNRIHVEVCKDLGDPSVPRPWSKYSKGSSSFSRKAREIEERKNRIKTLQSRKNPKKSEQVANVSVEEDEEFKEFLAVHLNKKAKKVWTNEVMVESQDDVKNIKVKKNKTKEDDISQQQDEDQTDFTSESSVEKNKNNISDLDWLKSKATKSKGESSASNENIVAETSRAPHNENACNKSTPALDTVTLKLRGIPFKCSEKEIITFFHPFCIEDIRFPVNKKGKPSGYCFVDFETPDDAHRAFVKHNNEMLQGRYVELFPVQNQQKKEDDRKWINNEDSDPEDISSTGRLFLRNLSYTCTEADLQDLFSCYGPLVEINLPVDKNSNRTTGYAFVTFMMPDHSIKALTALDGSIFQGRVLHVLPGKSKKTKEIESVKDDLSSYQQKKENEKKSLSNSSHNWNTLFLGHNAVADAMAARLNVPKRGILDGETKSSIAVRMALGETELVSDTRKFLESHGVKLDCFGQAITARSKTVLLVKNLPQGTTNQELKDIFSKYGDLGRMLMPPFGITAIVEFIQAKDAKEAFCNLAYSKFKHAPLYLEWAPTEVLTGEVKLEEEKLKEEENEESSEDEEETGAVIFVKNLNFSTLEEKLNERFSSCGKVKSATIAKKQDPKKPGGMLSMGYGFVAYKKVEGADKAMKMLQNCELDGHKLELKKSHRDTVTAKSSRKKSQVKKQTSSKIIVRNIPFEANIKEVKELFSTFGHIKSVRLPKKLAGTGSHRGFAFIDFTTKQDAKAAFKALCQSTHLYGRRLVLEWADDDESVDLLRKKTADHFHEGADPEAKKSKTELQTALEMAPSP